MNYATVINGICILALLGATQAAVPDPAQIAGELYEASLLGKVDIVEKAFDTFPQLRPDIFCPAIRGAYEANQAAVVLAFLKRTNYSECTMNNEIFTWAHTIRHSGIVKCLIDDYIISDEVIDRALAESIHTAHTDMIEILVKSPNVYEPLLNASLYVALEHGPDSLLAYLVEDERITSDNIRGAFSHAVMAKNVDILNIIILSQRAALQKICPLLWAAEESNVEIFDYILDSGNISETSLIRAMHIALCNYDKNIMWSLLKKTAVAMEELVECLLLATETKDEALVEHILYDERIGEDLIKVALEIAMERRSVPVVAALLRKLKELDPQGE